MGIRLEYVDALHCHTQGSIQQRSMKIAPSIENQSPTQRTLRGIDKLQIQSPIAAKGKWRPPNVSKPLSEHGVALNNHIT